jgi:hypothetical protein
MERIIIEEKEYQHEEGQPCRQEELDRLIQQAVAQPGLAALMEVYQSAWFRLGTHPVQIPMPSGKVTVSTNSLPPTT